MNAKEYVENVLVTEARDFTPVKERMTETRLLRLIHASVGITSEITELFQAADKGSEGTLDRTNILEECGDILWYLGIAADALGSLEMLEMRSLTNDTPMHNQRLSNELRFTGITLSKLSGEFADVLVKKHVFYGKPLNTTKLIEIGSFIHGTVCNVLEMSGFTIEQARERNIAKLKARYGSKFTEAAAQKRDLDTERKVLENKE